MAATPKRVTVDVEPRVAPMQSRIKVSLLAQDGPTAVALASSKQRGPYPMSPRNFFIGQVLKVGNLYLLIGGVIHDVEDPAGVTLLVSVMEKGRLTDV